MSQPDESGMLGPVTIAPSAGLVIIGEIGRWEHKREIAFVASWDPSTRTILTARVIGRGSETGVPVVLDAVEPGGIVLHNHPGGDTMPSDADLAMATECAGRGLGCGIIAGDCSSAYLITEPHDIVPPAYHARCWQLGPFTVIYQRSAR